MSARYDNRETQVFPFIPGMAKEVIFWCAVFIAVVTGAVLIGQMGPSWPVPVPLAQAAPVSVAAGGSSVEERTATPASDTSILDASDSSEQPPTF
jgi:hypothetical protein